MKQMDSGDYSKDGAKATRRSTRQSLKTVPYGADLKPRAPIKRTRKVRDQSEGALSRAVNGSKETKSKDDDEPLAKAQKLQEPEEAGDENDKSGGDQADVEMDENVDKDEDMNSEEEAEQDHVLLQYDKYSADVQEENLEPKVIMGSRRSIHKTVEPELPKPKKEPRSLGAVPILPKTLDNREGVEQRSSPIIQYHTIKETKDYSRGIPLESGDSYRQFNPIGISVCHTNSIYNRRKDALLKNAEKLKNTPRASPASTSRASPASTPRASPASTTRGCMWYVCKLLQWSLILIGLPALSLFTYQSSLSRTDVVQPIIKEKFNTELAALQVRFPSQRSVFWKRSLKHLERHLQTVNPTEPVSLILTAGFKAERTLACLARSLATAFSASLNKSSILEIDGTAKTRQNSDQVKLDIDTDLRNAFEGNKTAAVVHRFEELPPGSTLIFYRYCDHENAAYKEVFLAFTVMLSVDEIETDSSLSAVEDMVHDRIKEKFVSGTSAKFNEMDVDKLSGLWSRISHVILPLSAEEKIEQQGCEA